MLAKRGMAYDRMATVEVYWGLTPGPNFRDPAQIFYADFDLRTLAAQDAIEGFCERAEANPKLKVWKKDCWMQNYAAYMRSNGADFPSPNFEQDILNYKDIDGSVQHHVGWSDEGSYVIWVSALFRVEFDSHSGGYQTKPYMNAWKDFAAEENKRVEDMGISGLGPVSVCGDIFVRAEAESRIINSAISSFLCSVGCALLAVVAFTRNIFLSATATFAMFATAACSLYTIICVFRWHFGLMEAVSLIIFCGFSVDYPLHVVQAYVQERRDGAGVREALNEVGYAVASGCITTVGAASFLLMCEIRIFRRFGQVLMANMIFALLFALLWIPAVLELREMMCSKRSKGDSAAPAGDGSNGHHSSLSARLRSRVPRLNLARVPRLGMSRTEVAPYKPPMEGFEELRTPR